VSLLLGIVCYLIIVFKYCRDYYCSSIAYIIYFFYSWIYHVLFHIIFDIYSSILHVELMNLYCMMNFVSFISSLFMVLVGLMLSYWGGCFVCFVYVVVCLLSGMSLEFCLFCRVVFVLWFILSFY